MNEFERVAATCPWEVYFRTSEEAEGYAYFETQKEAEAVALIIRGEATVADFDFPVLFLVRPADGSNVVFAEARRRISIE